MTKILILYESDQGHTKAMAEAAAAGANTVQGTIVNLKKAEVATAEDLIESDGIILGSQVHMGSPDWRIKKFIDSICSGLWMKNSLCGKVAGVFASGGGYGGAGGGCELTMLGLLTNFAELGMLIVPLPKNTPGYQDGGLQWGPYGRSSDNHHTSLPLLQGCLECTHHHGANIARIAALVAGKDLLAKEKHIG